MFAAATPLSKAAITEALGYVACQDPDDARQAAELSVTLLRDEARSVQPLRDEDRSVQSAACHVLALVAERQPGTLGFVVPVVVQMLNEPETEIRTAAEEALRSIAEGVHARTSRKFDNGSS